MPESSAGWLVILWWLFFSRAAWSERLGAIVLMVVAVAVTSRLVHESIANGMMGFMLFIYAVPVLSLALVAWAVASRGLSSGRRRASMVAAILLACGALTLVRTNGITGDADSDLEWRWTPTAEERLLAQAATTPESSLHRFRPAARTPRELPIGRSDAPAETRADASPQSARRTPRRCRCAAIERARIHAQSNGPASADRRATASFAACGSKPTGLARRRSSCGAGRSGRAGHPSPSRGDRLFTQEQRGDDEIVSAYNLKTGEPVWRHRDAARFWESNAGAGPRATPTLSNGRVYTLGGNRNPERARRP